MGFQLLEIGIKMKKGVIFTIRGCFRSVCNHPFLVGNLCFLIFLYRSFPFIFSLLVSASPVLICTAILLGTVMSLGQPNIPEIEIEEKTTYESVSIKTGVSKDAIVVEQNESHYYVGRYTDVKRDEAEQLSNEQSSSESRNDEICREGISNVEEEKSREIESGNDEIWEDTIDEPKDDNNEWNEERLSDGEVVENHYSSILKAGDENVELDDVDSFNSETVNVDSLNSPHSPWKHVENSEDEENEEDVVSDSGSDGAESSSPDASMSDIMPMLDELHPLLDEDSSNPIQISLNASGIASERSSSRASTSSCESADEIENRDDFEVEDDDNEDDNEDEEVDGQGDKDERSKSAITWTEEDQKNLMDLGSSEIERNQRLENLILRRRKNVSMVPEINLIDLESYDFPPHVASISTSRQNPFDDPYDNIPGSAPSILLQRRNPFEIPYDSSQEKANPMGDDGFQEQLPFFKRHESFNVGPSLFAPNRQDVKMRPYFVPERMISEELGFSPFHRQSSELSDSKASSIPETESIGSVEDLEDQKLPEEDNSQEPEVISRAEEVIEEGPPEDQEIIFERESFKEDVINEPQLISEMNHVSEHIGHGSQSSDEEDEESSEFKQSYSRGSSSSLMSEASERTFTEIDNEGSSNLDGIRRRNDETEEPDMSTRISVESGELNITSALADDNSHKEPVYDSSPTSVKKNLSSSSISCDVHAESNPSLPPVLVKRKVSFVERDSENREIEKGITSDTEILSQVHNVGVREHDDVNSISLVEASEVEILVDNNKNLGQSLIIDKEETVASPNSDGDYQEANERLMSTPSGGGSTSHFYDIAMHEPNFEQLEEVPVPNTPIESNDKMHTIQNLNIPEIYELDHDTSPSIGSPFSPDFISMPSSASSHVDMQTIHEEADEIKEIDEGLSSDFSVTDEFEKHIIDSVGETNTMHETEHEMNLENPRVDEIDVYEEGTKCISEPQTSHTSEHIDTSNGEFSEMDGQDFTVQETYEEGTYFSEENEDKPTNSVLNHDYRDNDDSLPKNDECQSTSVGQVYTDTASRMPELETSRKSLDGKLEKDLKPKKDLKPNTDDRSLEVEAEKVDSFVGEESSVKEESSISAEKKPHHEVKKAPEDLDSTAYVEGKGNESESSSSSSSSCSSESDTE